MPQSLDSATDRPTRKKKETPVAIMRRRCGNEFVKLQAHRKPQDVDFFLRHTIASQHLGRWAVGDDGTIARVAIPCLVDHCGVGDDHVEGHIHLGIATANSLQDVAEDGVGRGHQIRLEFPHQRVDCIGELKQKRGHALYDFRLAEHRENDLPKPWVIIDSGRIAFLDAAVHHGIRERVRIYDERLDNFSPVGF